MILPHRPLADLTSQELHQRATEYRRMAMTARSEATIASLNKLAARYAVLAARREVEETAQQDRVEHPSGE